jgi:uncharacterized protein (DUF433 family)
MGRKSKIEAHPQYDEIVNSLISGKNNPEIVRNFPEITDDDLDYYREVKLPKLLSKSKDLKSLADEIEQADIHRGDTYLQLITGLQKKALDALELQDPSSDPKSWAMVSKEARGYLELLGKALDRIRDQPPIGLTQVNIYQSPEWSKVGEILASILDDYPELKVQVAGELLALARDGGK